MRDMRIEEIFPEGHWESEQEYRIRCPICGDNPDKPDKHNCAINVVKRIFHCWFCECKGTLKELLQKEFQEEIKPAPAPKTQVIVPIDFSQFLPVTGERDGVMDGMALGYLRDRGITLDDVKRYDIRYSNKVTFFGRIIIPITENDKVVCFVGRSFINSKLKYLYPRRGETPLSVGKVVFGLDSAIKTNAQNVVITEGIFDAIAVDRINGLRGVALLGHNLSKTKLYKLLKLPRLTRFFVCMDADMHEDTIKIAKTLSEYREDVWVVLLKESNTDPASLDKEHLSKAMANATKFFPGLEANFLEVDKYESRQKRCQTKSSFHI